MGKYIIYREEFYLGSWIIVLLEIIGLEYASESLEIGPNLRHCLSLDDIVRKTL